MLLPPSNGPRESRRKWAKMDFARYARECAAGGPLATWGDGPGCVGSGGSDPKQRGSDFAFWGSHFTRGPTVCRRMHPSSQAYGAECDIFLWLSPSSECVLTHAHLSNSIDIRRDGKGYPIERMSSCAQSAQLVVCSAESHTLVYDRKGVPARARTALWWSSGETVRLVHR